MARYAAPILGVVGAVVGTAFGAPQLGYMLGSAIGGLISSSAQVIPGPKIGEITAQTSQEGGFRPIVYGRSQPMSGVIIADSKPKIVKRSERQGKGGPRVESESAFRTYAVGVCEGEAGLLQAWRNGILVYDAEDPGMAPENAKFLEYATWYTGSYTQNASPDLESVYGVGNTPYFRGTAYLSIYNEDVTDQRGQWSQWTFRVFCGELSGGELFSEQFDGGLTNYTAFTPPGTVGGGTLADFSIVESAFGHSLLVGTGQPNTHPAIRTPLESSARLRYCKFKVRLETSGLDDCGQIVLRDQNLNNVFAFGIRRDSTVDALRRPEVHFIDRPGIPGSPIGPPGGVSLGVWYQVDVEYDADSSNFSVVMTDLSTMEVFGSLSIEITGRTDVSFVSFENDNFIGAGTCMFDDVQILTDTEFGQWKLPAVVGSISERANLSIYKTDLSFLDAGTTVRGFTIGNAYQAAGSLQALSSIFFFDPFTANGYVCFKPRGGNVVATILQNDLIDDSADIEDSSSRRMDSLVIPRVLHLNYYDVAGGLNTDKQRSERPEGMRAEGEQSLQTTVILTADEAATVVSITHGLMVEQQKGELNITLPDNWLSLTEADPVFIQTDTKMVRAIIAKVEMDDGEQRYKLVRDRQSLYTTQIQGIPAAPVTRPPSSIAGPTLIELLDTPILRDAHDMLGFYIAASGIMPAWPGATIELSIDGGQNYIEAQTTRTSSIVGELVTALGDHPYPFPDQTNSCQVKILTPDASLENSTLAGMMSRRNMAIIGGEIVNFADPDEVIPGTWEISHWLRGRKGTDTVAHAIGERFVMLDTVVFVPADLSWLNRSLTFRATTFGRPIDEATIATFTFTGQSQAERAPAYLQARRDGGNVVSTWQGVGRLGGGVHVAMGAHFAGFLVTLTDGTTTQTHNTGQPGFTGSLGAFVGPVTVRVQQRNNFTGLGPHIEVTI